MLKVLLLNFTEIKKNSISKSFVRLIQYNEGIRKWGFWELKIRYVSEIFVDQKRDENPISFTFIAIRPNLFIKLPTEN